MAQPVYLSLVLLAAVVGMGVAFLAWLHRDRAGAAPLSVFVITASLWAMAEGLELAAAGLGPMRLLASVELVLSSIIPLAWLATVLAHTGREDWLTRRRLAALLVEPLVVTVLAVTGGGHDLVWVRGATTAVAQSSAFTPVYGVAYWGHLAYTLAVVAAGGALLVRPLVRTNGVFRWQGTALLAAIAVPMVAHALFVFDLLPAGFDPTSLGYVFSGVVLSAAILRQRLLSIAPVTRDLGREAVLAEMDDPVLILDDDRRVVDVNRAGAALFDRSRESLVGEPLDAVSPDLAAALPADPDGAAVETSLSVDGTVRHYDVRTSRLHRAGGAVSGTIVSLRDVTNRRQREQRLDVLNRLLRHNLRNDLNLVRGNAELLADAVPADERDRVDHIIDAVDGLVDRADKIGRVSTALEDDGRRPTELRALLTPLVDDARERTAGTVALSCPADVWVLAGPSLSVAVEELLDNAIEHHDGVPEIAVEVDPGGDRVAVRVRDDGPGIADHERAALAAGEETPLQHASGVGLWLVAWVVRNFGGTLSFDVTAAGTTVTVSLPRASPPESVDGAA